MINTRPRRIRLVDGCAGRDQSQYRVRRTPTTPSARASTPPCSSGVRQRRRHRVHALEIAERRRDGNGLVPFDRPAEAEMRPDQLRQIPLVIGIRNLIHDQTDPDWLVRAEVDEGLTDLESARVSFDLISTLPRHFEHVTGLGERHPGRRVVIGHLSRPPFGEADREPWWSLIERAAENSLVSAKVSRVYPASGPPTEWSTKSVRPYFERALRGVRAGSPYVWRQLADLVSRWRLRRRLGAARIPFRRAERP